MGNEILEDRKKMIQLYNYQYANQPVETQYGRITYVEWLKNEEARIKKGIGRICEIKSSGRMVSLFVNRIA